MISQGRTRQDGHVILYNNQVDPSAIQLEDEGRDTLKSVRKKEITHPDDRYTALYVQRYDSPPCAVHFGGTSEIYMYGPVAAACSSLIVLTRLNNRLLVKDGYKYEDAAVMPMSCRAGEGCQAGMTRSDTRV